MKIILKKKAGQRLDFANPWKCPIAKALKRKWIIPFINLNTWGGLLLGFIPIWGTIPNTTNQEAQRLCRSWNEEEAIETSTSLRLYDRTSIGGAAYILAYSAVVLAILLKAFL